jgi:acyl-CoA thioesterase-2
MGRLDPQDGGTFVDLSLVDRLRIAPDRADEFTAAAPDGYERRVYGGHLLAQALLAASATVPPERRALSLHALFVRPGSPAEELRYVVSPLRDGRSFSARDVDVRQGDRLLASCRATFLVDRDDGSPSRHLPMPDVPAPEQVPSLHERRNRHDLPPDGFNWPPGEDWQRGSRPLDVRYVDLDREHEPRRCFWFRTEPGGETQAEQRAVLAFCSDRSLLPTIRHAAGGLHRTEHVPATSIDHAMWFHGDVTAGEWWLYVQDSPFGSSTLGLVDGRVYAQDGRLVASVVQQGVLAPPPGRAG